MAPFRCSVSKSLCLRFYSDAVGTMAARKWGLQGVTRPRSILEDDDAEVDLSEDNDRVNGAHPDATPAHLRRPTGKPTPQQHKAHRETLRKTFPEGWAPPRKLSREAMETLRQLQRMDPQTFSTPMLADRFKISPEAVRRILRSRWQPSMEKRTALLAKEGLESLQKKAGHRAQRSHDLETLNESSKLSDFDSDLEPEDKFHFR